MPSPRFWAAWDWLAEFLLIGGILFVALGVGLWIVTLIYGG